MTLDKALSMAERGLAVFPVRVGADNSKTPLTPHGHLDATTDPAQISRWWGENPSAEVGVWVGGANLIVLDVDVKNGKDGWESLDQAWLDIPETFGYDTPSGGRHLVYRHPEHLTLSPSSNYRGMAGVDTRAGSSWVLWNGPVPPENAFADAPEWLLDATPVKSSAAFQGDVSEWYEQLLPGEPSGAVRRAMERIPEDMSHSDMVAATFEAIRLGAEQHPGVPQLIAALEEAWLNRDPSKHTTPEDRWEYKFHEAMASGIQKYGESIEIAKQIPPYSLSLVPAGVPDSAYMGEPGDKNAFTRLLTELTSRTSDVLTMVSVLWNAPVTREVAREWGLQFTYLRVVEALEKREPSRHSTPAVSRNDNVFAPLVTESEREVANNQYTFIDAFTAGSATKGFVNRTYAVPFAWTCLSMAVGTGALIPKDGAFGVNLWFNVLGYSGTGKTSELQFATSVLDILFRGQETYYNLGTSSSPEGLHESLLQRDNLSSLILEDEAATFFSNLRTKSWMDSLTHYFSDWYNGHVRASNKVRLKELKGKTATTSFNMHLTSTPDKTLRLLDSEMFETGFLARTNWVLGDPPLNREERFESTLTEPEEDGFLPVAYELALDLLYLRNDVSDERIRMSAAPDAQKRLDESHAAMDRIASSRPLYALTEPSVTRLSETSWKCAALLALWRGSKTIELDDVLVALTYVEEWFNNLFRVVERVTQGDFQRDCLEIVEFLRGSTEPVARDKLLKAFGSMIQRHSGELNDRIDYLLESGLIERSEVNKKVAYRAVE